MQARSASKEIRPFSLLALRAFLRPPRKLAAPPFPYPLLGLESLLKCGHSSSAIPLCKETDHGCIPIFRRPSTVANYPASRAQPWPPARPRRGFFGRLLLSLFLLVFVGSILLNLMLLGWAAMNAAEGDSRIQEKYVSHNRRADGKVAVISVEGVILEAEDGFVKRQIDRVMDDKNVKAVVLRVDSPGGSVSGSDYIYHHLRTMLEKAEDSHGREHGQHRGQRRLLCVDGRRPRAGHDFRRADRLHRLDRRDHSALRIGRPDGEDRHKDDSIISNPLKGMGGVARPMTKDKRHIFQNLVDESFTHFKDIVKSGRSKFDKDSAALDKLATGQVFTAEQAKKDGLIDSLGFIEDAVDQAIELAKLDKDEVRVVRYKPEPTLANLFMGGQSQGRAELDLRAILDITSPRAYYLCTWLPAVAGSRSSREHGRFTRRPEGKERGEGGEGGPDSLLSGWRSPQERS